MVNAFNSNYGLGISWPGYGSSIYKEKYIFSLTMETVYHNFQPNFNLTLKYKLKITEEACVLYSNNSKIIFIKNLKYNFTDINNYINYYWNSDKIIKLTSLYCFKCNNSC